MNKHIDSVTAYKPPQAFIPQHKSPCHSVTNKIQIILLPSIRICMKMKEVTLRLHYATKSL